MKEDSCILCASTKICMYYAASDVVNNIGEHIAAKQKMGLLQHQQKKNDKQFHFKAAHSTQIHTLVVP